MESIPIRAVLDRFVELFGEKSQPTIATAPGRVNLIGEHTDYNDGFAFPMAIDRHVAIAFEPRSDLTLRAHSVFFQDTKSADMSALTAPGGTDWFDYVAGVAWAMREAGMKVSGADMVIAGDVPVGAGLASSAALEMSVARALCKAGDLEWEPTLLAQIGQHGENRYVGVNCGIMDQFAAVCCEAENALLLDCRTLQTELVPVPNDAVVVVMDTGVRRKLSGSEYNDRRRSCENAVRVLSNSRPGLTSLRDVDLGMLDAAKPMMDPTTYRRAAHVVAEIGRPGGMAESFRGGDLTAAGELMDESHESLRDLYEVSCGELDLITTLARQHQACYGARMTGAGFGGCAVALVDLDGSERFVAEIARKYSATTGTQGAMYACRPSGGAAIVAERFGSG